MQPDPALSAAHRPDVLADPMLLREWFAVAWSCEIAPGAILARRFMGRDALLWRSAEGLVCWRDLCIHRGAKLSLGTVATATSGPQSGKECLVCPYHAWHYSPSGQCVLIPAQPGQPPPAKARTSLAGPYLFRASGPRVIENLFDVAHLGYVHAGMLGDPQHLEIEDYEVTLGPYGPEATNIRIWQPDPDGTGRSALVEYHYWARGPLTAGLTKRPAQNDGAPFAILASVVPIDADACESRLIITIDANTEVSDADLLRFQDTVTAQDKIIVESQRPELLPLDLQSELHLRSDRMAIAYRKWLRDIGFTYGTA